MVLFHSPSFLKSCTMGPKNQHEAFGKVLFFLRRLLKMRDFLWIWQSLVTQDTFGQHNWGKKLFFWPRHSMYLSYTIKLSKNGKIIRCEKFLFYFDILTLSLQQVHLKIKFAKASILLGVKKKYFSRVKHEYSGKKLHSVYHSPSL